MAHARLRFGPYELDLDGRQLRHHGQQVRAEPRAIELLCHLAAHRDRVVTRQQLLDTVWSGHPVSESAIAATLRAARHAVGDTGGSQEIIRTIHRRGYQFIADVAPAANPGDYDTVRFCQTRDGTRLAYTVTGSGPPLISAANWLTHLGLDRRDPMWIHWYRDLMRETRRGLRYDERGCGLSDWCPPSPSPQVWVEDLDTVADAAGYDTFAIIGTAQAAATAIAYAALRPERITRMVLISSHARGRQARAHTDLDRRVADVDLDLATVAWQSADPAFLRAYAALFLPNAAPAELDAYIAFTRRTTSLENLVHFFHMIATMDVFPLVERVRCPTLILHARGDPRVPASDATELAALIGDSRLVLLDSTNHLFTATEPAWAELVRHVDDFLAD
ncbi:MULTISPECIES: alpha/beta fold hydrolase [unclassified Solwaraspora]|uniref:alpha/beta fold hydrolase n=1 Tax=unclassified Solwaraspora TaxID=2627926 RepID=UPI00259BE79F|nr:alpha/beta fold hydrolase [Solwaraspora sp. WMMA2056]WJK38465.1 alpha/beta fold hydrolase [Solwaraspora sp. WMMA2056]